jgi:prevent-host-death family protein
MIVLTHGIVYGVFVPRGRMKTVNATKARQNLYQLVDEVNSSNEPVYIKGKRANAVLVSEADWKSIQETLYLISIPGMNDLIVEGFGTPLSECSDDVGW